MSSVPYILMQKLDLIVYRSFICNITLISKHKVTFRALTAGKTHSVVKVQMYPVLCRVNSSQHKFLYILCKLCQFGFSVRLRPTHHIGCPVGSKQQSSDIDQQCRESWGHHKYLTSGRRSPDSAWGLPHRLGDSNDI